MALGRPAAGRQTEAIYAERGQSGGVAKPLAKACSNLAAERIRVIGSLQPRNRIETEF
jgi:hypothetical protein